MITKSSRSRRSALLVPLISLIWTICAFGSPIPPTGYSSAPGSANCASCHSPAAGGTGSVGLSFSGGSTEYLPGQTFPLTVTVSDSALNQFGFSMVARDADNNTVDLGTWIAGGLDTVVNSVSSHVNSLNTVTNNNPHTFTVNWTAPAAGLGNVTFYVSALASDGSGSAGDRTFVKNLTISEVVPLNPIVTNTDPQGPGSLREAVEIAVPGDTVTFSPALDGGTITLGGSEIVTLGGSEIVINKNLTIDASELLNGVTIDGGGTSRIFLHNSGTVVLQSLTIANGNSTGFGGGIFSFADLTINDCRLINNHSSLRGGALTSAFGSLTMNRSTVSGNTCDIDGGLYLQDLTATIRDSTISGNSGAEGNGLGVNASSENCTVSLVNSTVANNVTSNAIAGLELTADTGQTCDVTLDHSTVSKNSSAAAGTSGILLTETGGGTVSLTMMNSIVSGNTAGGAPSDITGTAVASSSFNLIGTGGGLTHGVNGNQVGINNPLLGPLCNNGGPTRTMRPIPGSPVINAGGTTGLTEDQRGFPRSVGTAIDIGAVESERVTYDLEWSGTSFGNSASATGRITFDPAILPNPGNIDFDPLLDFTITVSGASSGNGVFSRSDFDDVRFQAGGQAFDLSTELVGQATLGDPWGTSQPGNTGGDFNLFRMVSSPLAPSGTYYFELSTAGGEKMLLTSFRPASGQPPTGSVVHPANLTSAFPSRTVLVDAPGEVAPAPVLVSSSGSATIWEWTPSTAGWFDVSTFGSTFDTRLTVYEGTSAASLIYLAGNDDAFPGEFAADHPEPDRSAMVLPFSAGTTYQFVISGGANGASGGTLNWRIQPVSEPLPPSVETRTHDFAFPPTEYNAATALIDTIVPIIPIGGYGTTEPYVHIVDTRSAVWDTVIDGDVTASPFLGVGSTIRTSDADQLSSQPRLSAPITPAETPGGGGFVNPPSSAGPFVTVVSARYPHRYGAGHEAICVDLSAQGGQGHGLTHMPKTYFEDDPTPIGPNEGGLIIDFQFEGTPPSASFFGYSLKDPDNNVIHSAQGLSAEQLIAVAPGPYSICFDPVPGYRILVTQDGIPNIIEGGSDLTNISRDLCVIFPNSIDCTHLNAPNFVTQPVLAASECNVQLDTVTTVNVYYIELATGTDTIGYIDVSAPEELFLQQTDVLGEDAFGIVINPLIESALLTPSSAPQTKVLVMEPDETASVGRLVTWKTSAPWVKFRNFITTGDLSCYECHSHVFEDNPGPVYDVEDMMTKVAGGRPKVPWFQVDPSIPTSAPFVTRIVPMDDEPYILGMFIRPFDKPLNHRMPIDIQENPSGSAARLATVEYAGRQWQILQDAGSGYAGNENVTITSGNQINLTPGTRQQTVTFSTVEAQYWSAEPRNSSWITIIGGFFDLGPGSFSLNLSFDPNPGATPRLGIVQIGDVFLEVVQPIEPPEILSLVSLSNPNGFRFTLSPLNGVAYELQFSSSLMPGSWVPQAQEVGVRDQSELSFDAVFPTLPKRGFYRIESLPAQ